MTGSAVVTLILLLLFVRLWWLIEKTFSKVNRYLDVNLERMGDEDLDEDDFNITADGKKMTKNQLINLLSERR